MDVKVFSFGKDFLININEEYSIVSSGINKEIVREDIISNYNRIAKKNKENALEKFIELIGFSNNKSLINYKFELMKEDKDYYLVLPDNRVITFLYADTENNKAYFSIKVEKDLVCRCFFYEDNVENQIVEVLEEVIKENYLFATRTPIFLFRNKRVRKMMNYIPLLIVA